MGVSCAAAGVSAGENQPNALLLCYPVISARNHAREIWFSAQMNEQTRERLIEKLSCELHVGPQTPPTFLFHTYQDGLVPVENSLLFARALAQADIPFELHIFEHGAHGLSLANELTSSGGTNMLDASAEQWFGLATNWLWRLFGKPASSGEKDSMPRAHFAVPQPSSTAEHFPEKGATSTNSAGEVV